MSEASDIAAKIDAMTLDELMGANEQADLPKPGGDYDMKTGWAKRMGKSSCDNTFRRAWDLLEEAKLITPVIGQVKRGEFWQRHTLYHSPVLARKIEASTADKA